MEEQIKNAVEKYQCPGCVKGHNISCFEGGVYGVGCGKHVPGTTILPIVGKIFLGMPKGFNRIGETETILSIFEKFEVHGDYDSFNIPVWKHLTKDGHTLVRGLSPRINYPFLHVFLEDCLSKVDCLEVTEELLAEMD